jgi:hypothetical protein
MARINVTLPDELATLVRTELPGLNVSGVLQEALQRLVRCEHRELGCSCCGARVVRRELEGAILSGFFAEAMWRLQEPVSRCATAEGAARVLRDLAQAWEVPRWDHVPLPRPTKAERARAHAELMKEAQREEAALFESGTKPRRRAAGVA